jgi:hypothetical protein
VSNESISKEVKCMANMAVQYLNMKKLFYPFVASILYCVGEKREQVGYSRSTFHQEEE